MCIYIIYIYIYIYIYIMCVCACVCVTSKYVKLLLFLSSFFSLSNKAGGLEPIDLPIQSNEAMAFRWMSGLINHLYLHHWPRWWQEAKPRTSPNTFMDLLIYTVAAIWISWQLFWRLYSGLVYVGYFRKIFIVLAKYNHEIYFRSNCLGLLHVTGLSSWWIRSKIQFCLV